MHFVSISTYTYIVASFLCGIPITSQSPPLPIYCEVGLYIVFFMTRLYSSIVWSEKLMSLHPCELPSYPHSLCFTLAIYFPCHSKASNMEMKIHERCTVPTSRLFHLPSKLYGGYIYIYIYNGNYGLYFS